MTIVHSASYLATTQALKRAFDEIEPASWPCLDSLLDFGERLFNGEVPGYQACDTAFHDFDHTMHATRALADLLLAYYRKDFRPELAPRHYEIAVAGALFHDVGYLKQTGDQIGTGAKYSTIHVGRGCLIAWDLLPQFGFVRDEIRQVQNAISATAIAARINELPYQNEQEWIIGALVATADVLGQMAAEDYPERLAGLYLEFREASTYSRFLRSSFASYRNLVDLIGGTEKFFSEYILKMLNEEWRGVYRLADDPSGTNPYIAAIRKNIARTNLIASLLSEDEKRRKPVSRTRPAGLWKIDEES